MTLLPDVVRGLAERWPDAEAYRVLGGGTLTFEAWDRGASRIAHGLIDRGVEPGDPVALLFEPDDILRFLQAYTGAHKAGAIAVLVNSRFGETEIEHLLDHAQPAVTITSGTFEDVASDDDEDVQAEIDEHAPADVVYTGGTTGLPKGVLTRHDNTTQLLTVPDDFQGTYWLYGTPFESQAGQAFIHTPAALGMTVLYLVPPFDPEGWLDAVAEYPVSATYLAPVMVEQLLASPRIDEADLSQLGIVTVGSAPIAPATLRRFAELLPNTVPQNSYSLTELGTGFTQVPPDRFEEKVGSVGEPVDPLEVRIVDPETGEDVPEGEEGEVWARVPGKEREYWRADGRNEETFVDGWVRTGDLGRLDEDGFLWVDGRIDDVIITSGYNVNPADPQRAIYEHEGVREAVVVGVPAEEIGEEIVAAVVPRDGSGLDEDSLRRFLEERLGEAKRPHRIVILDELPRTSRGKVRKQELVDRLR